MPSQLRLAVATFVIGAGVMAVELTASRLLAPYFGASMFVWTSLIVTVLAALSVGYYLGGLAAARKAGTEVVGLLCVGASGFLALGTLVIPRFSTAISGMLVGLSSASIALFLGSLLVTVVVFAVPVFMMAVCGPVLLKHWTAHGDVGVISGRYFMVSTVGSVLGTVAPTLWLVPAFGARATVYAVAAAFLLLGASLLAGRARLAAGAALVVLLGVGMLPHPGIAGVLFERESPYQLIRVSEGHDGTRYLIFNEGSGVQSVYSPGGGRTGFYYDYMGIVPLLRPASAPQPTRVLIVGLAGGTVAHNLGTFAPEAALDVTGVEVDAAVIDAARRFFDLDAAGVQVRNDDGRMYLLHEQRAAAPAYNAIVSDAYSTQLYIPPHLATTEYFALVRERLVPGGVSVMNVNAPTADSRLLTALVNTAASVFPYVTVVDVQNSWNHLVLASDQPLDLGAVAGRVPQPYADVAADLLTARAVTFDPAGEVFTDDRAPVEFLTDSMIVSQVLGRTR